VLELGIKARLARIRVAMSQAIWAARSRRLGHYKAYPRPDVAPHTYDSTSIRALIAWIDSDGMLRTVDQVYAALKREMGWRSSGPPGDYVVGQIERARQDAARRR